MVALKTVLVVAMVLMFVDAIIQHITGGGILIQGDTYSFIELLFFIFQLIITFLGIIVHGLTHWDQIGNDFFILVDGIITFLFFLVQGIADIYWHLITIPFLILGWVADTVNIGLGFKIDIPALGGILFDLRTLTFQIQFGNIDGLDILGIKFYIKNTVGFSLIGNSEYPSMRAFTGQYFAWYKSGMGGLSIALDFKDGAETCFPNLVKIGQCILDNLPPLRNPLECLDPSNKKFKCEDVRLILETPASFKVISFKNLLDQLFESIPIPRLRDWMEDTWIALGFGVIPNVTGVLQYFKINLEKVVLECQKRIHLVYHGKILDMELF